MTVGISLLTLVPGIVGGSETYARELVRALGRVGELDYRVFKTSVVGEDLPGTTVRSYRASRTFAGRATAMASAAVAPRRLRRELELGKLDAIHFPLTVMLPRVDDPPAAVARCLDAGVVIRDLPGTPLVRASCGWWTSDEDLERLVETLG